MMDEHDVLLLPLLRKEQKERGYLSEEVLKKISRKTGVPISRVYGVATFYSMLHTEKQGRNVIEVCSSPSCCVNGSLDIVRFLEKELKIKAGKTTTNKDGKFSLYKTSCIGCCDHPPAMLLNGRPFTDLTEEKLRVLIRKCGKKKRR